MAKDMFFWGKDSRGRMVGVSPILRILATHLLSRCRFDVCIPPYGGKRTEVQQKGLWARGRTEGGNIVTHADGVARKSKHQSGLALDIVPCRGGVPIWPDESHWWEEISGIMMGYAKLMNVPLVWGGHWKKFLDRPHWEIPVWLEG